MEIASPPPPPPPPQKSRFDSAGYTAASPSRNPFASADEDEGNPFLAMAVTAPPSPNPFELLPPATAGVGDTDPFDLFQHFTSAPASPTRAAAIYAQFSSVDDGNGAGHDSGDDDDDGFQPRVSYSPPTVTSTVPFDWEEMPGKPKPGFGRPAATANGDVEDADFDFGVLLDRSAKTAPELTTADELFDEGKIRPLKPPPRLLDSGSVGSSPRSARSAMWSPRLRSHGGPGPDFDPFAAAMANASKAPSPLGAGVKDAADTGTAVASPANPDSVTSPRTEIPPSASNSWRKKWRLSDLLLFRRLSSKGPAAGSISKDPVFKYSPVQRLGTPVKNATAAEPVAANGDDVSAGKPKKQSRSAAAGAGTGGMAASHRQSLMGCVRLNPGLHRLAKGLNGSSSQFGRRHGTARAPAMNG